ncbi:hypothetical protein [Accumulibacter sp.]|uniref:hypothetical protein n=1 Tax=Accumulibacter sp. TaxID=2053492 RepID=UPI0025835B4B|nr:hypothetical protein [Accumulibacter sp.]
MPREAYLILGRGGRLGAAAFAVSGWMMKASNPAVVIRNLVTNASSGRYSLSNLQILLWTLLVIFALSYAWFSTGVLLPLSSGILVLLGISGATSILARMAEGTDHSTAEPATNPLRKDLVWSEKEGFDLLRFQMLGFTLFTLSYSLVSVLRNEGLPDIPENLYTLMGISNAAYIGGKLPDKLTAISVRHAGEPGRSGHPQPAKPAGDTRIGKDRFGYA